MTWPAPTRTDHEKFCIVEGWVRVRDARGRTGTHHITYEITLRDGTRLRTRISQPPDRTVYGPALWAHILRDQLGVTQEEFWTCVKNGVSPARSRPPAPTHSLPLELAYLLTRRVGLAEDELASMTKDEALARIRRFWTDGS